MAAQKNYKLYLTHPEITVPKVTRWRHKKRRLTEEDTAASASNEDVSKLSSTDSAHHASVLVENVVQLEQSNFECDAGSDETIDDSPEFDEFTEEHRMFDDTIYADDEDDSDAGCCSDTDELVDIECQLPEDPGTGRSMDDQEDSIPGNLGGAEERFIYKGARLTVAASMIMILSFVLRHGLTGQALSDLLVLIEMHCLLPNLCRKTKKMFNDFFKNSSGPIEFHYYCTVCNTYIGCKKAQCPSCELAQKDSGQLSYFIMIPLIQQLQSLLDADAIDKIKKQKTSWMKRKGSSTITDVMDGKLYKEMFDWDGHFKGFRGPEDELHISFQVNTDGVSLFRSSTFSIWPLYMVINELPADVRFLRSNRIFLGLWFGKKKPHMQTFLGPLARCLKQLYTEGFLTKTLTTVKGVLLSGVFDSPARCLFQNMVQFNGFCGCPYCLTPGATFRTPAGGCTHIYPLDKDNPQTGFGKERTHADTIEQAKEADESFLRSGKQGKNVKGVKGQSWSMCLPKFDMIRGVAVDYMHCVCLGVTKMLMMLWFDKAHKKQSFNISGKMAQVNRRLMSIRPPNFVTRLPRPLTDMCHYKASEYKSFLLYFSLPCLLGILPDEIFQHYLLLVQAIYILLGDQISQRDIEHARRLLLHFCLNLPVYYGERYLTSNVHLLLHVADKVKDLGPLWANSCFYFEDFNGQLRSLFHGTQKVEKQVSLAVRVHQMLPSLAKRLRYGTEEFDFFHHLSGRALSKPKEFYRTCGILGSLMQRNLDDLERVIQEKVQILFGNVVSMWIFQRVLINQFAIHCVEYSPVTRRNSFTVCLQNCSFQFGQIVYYIKMFVQCPNPRSCFEHCACKVAKFKAVVRPLEVLTDVRLSFDDVTHATVSHLIPVKLRDLSELELIDIADIVDLCIYVDCEYVSFVVTRPNSVERE